MTALVNTQWRLKRRPQGLPVVDDFEFPREPLIAEEQLKDGDVLVRILAISIDPAMRGWMRAGKSYLPPVQLGDVMRAGGAGVVVASRNPRFPKGSHVSGVLGVQLYALVAGGRGLSSIDVTVAPVAVWISALGMPGLTAYFGLLEVGQPKAGETLVVSGAAGAVGSVVVQIGKILGMKVIGIAGSKEKCDWVRELGADRMINYKTDDVAAALTAALKDVATDGGTEAAAIDVYFDNVGGDILDVCLTKLAMHARVVICGGISQYNSTGAFVGPKNYMNLLVARARMEGFVVFDYAKKYHEAAAQMVKWINEGKLQARVHTVQGIERFVDALNGLFAGENIGKMILDVSDGAATATARARL